MNLEYVKTLRNYLKKTKDNWNYITPVDFYNNYYLKNVSRAIRKRFSNIREPEESPYIQKR
jgi:hypothetical protein